MSNLSLHLINLRNNLFHHKQIHSNLKKISFHSRRAIMYQIPRLMADNNSTHHKIITKNPESSSTNNSIRVKTTSTKELLPKYINPKHIITRQTIIRPSSQSSNNSTSSSQILILLHPKTSVMPQTRINGKLYNRCPTLLPKTQINFCKHKHQNTTHTHRMSSMLLNTLLYFQHFHSSQKLVILS